MKTVFKKGQKVYDQVNFPNIEGKILRLYSKDCESFPIEVYFGETLICYTIDGRIDLYSVPTLSTKPYKKESRNKFLEEQKELLEIAKPLL